MLDLLASSCFYRLLDLRLCRHLFIHSLVHKLPHYTDDYPLFFPFPTPPGPPSQGHPTVQQKEGEEEQKREEKNTKDENYSLRSLFAPPDPLAPEAPYVLEKESSLTNT